MKQKSKIHQNTSSLAPVIFIFCFTIGYILTGYIALDEDSRHVPVLTGFVTIILLIFESLKRFIFKGTEGAEESTPTEVEVNVPLTREVIGLLYIAGLAMAIFFLGFYVAIPLYLFVAIAYLGSQPKKSAITVAVIASVVIYIVFELLLETRLYQGLLFS
jgi:putative tricarboxylic transport membrane protein